jgi:hypothetical protein
MVPHGLSALPFSVFDLRFVACTAGAFPPFAGSAWRGGLGRALKRLVCIQRLRPCEGCALERGCLFTTLFDPRHDGSVALLRQVDRMPPPFVLDVTTPTPCRLAEGDPFGLRLVVVGRARHHAVYLLRALEEAGARGIGPDRIRFRLDEVTEQPEPMPGDLPPGRVAVEVVTPLRLRAGGQLVGPERFTPALFVQGLLRRLSLLAACWGEPPAPLPFGTLRDRLGRLEGTTDRLRWTEQYRRSFRQHTRMRMGGLTGSFSLRIEPADPLAPLLLAGEQLHVGKATTMGLGRYRLHPAPEGGAVVQL